MSANATDPLQPAGKSTDKWVTPLSDDSSLWVVIAGRHPSPKLTIKEFAEMMKLDGADFHMHHSMKTWKKNETEQNWMKYTIDDEKEKKKEPTPMGRKDG